MQIQVSRGGFFFRYTFVGKFVEVILLVLVSVIIILFIKDVPYLGLD